MTNELTMELRKSGTTRGVGLFASAEVRAPNAFTSDVDSSSEHSRILSVVNSKKPAFVVGLYGPIGHVLSAVGLSEIVPSVIGSVAVNVINLFGGPLAGDDEPRQAMGEVQLIVDPDLNTHRSLIDAARRLASETGVPVFGAERVALPHKTPSLWAVVQYLTSFMSSQVIAFRNWHGNPVWSLSTDVGCHALSHLAIEE